jgi:hypothetical protein
MEGTAPMKQAELCIVAHIQSQKFMAAITTYSKAGLTMP